MILLEDVEALDTRSELDPETEGPEELDMPDSEVVSELQLP